MQGFRLSLHTLFCSIEKEEKSNDFIHLRCLKKKKETNLPSRGGGMEKRREDGFAVILVKHEVVHRGGAKGGWKVWGRGHQSARAGFEDPPSCGGRRGD